ncbi:hypothetical protein CQW23_28631 [Capsicum baccatum]|uniref:Uncharacterized protein n=1 Tax=Capsicum baccatum TaxID=33114 RepID=A0A2G2VH36_CAPBA|nr:hypothetical protein CQW23_28631 [Capsicum baccatum]
MVDVTGRDSWSIGVSGRGRGFNGVAGRGRGSGGRGKGSDGVAGRGSETFIATTSNVCGVAGRGRGIFVVGTSNISSVRGSGRTFKRLRLVGMGVLHTQSDFIIHNPRMPLNSSVVSEYLGHHKPRLGVKCKGKNDVTQQGLQEKITQKRMKISIKAVEMNHMSKTGSSTV